MSQLFCVRADFGRHTESFVKGGYVAIGGYSSEDLSVVTSRGQLEDIHSSVSPNNSGNVLAGQQMDQVARFLLEIKAGDLVITPSLNTEYIYYGMVRPEPNYFYQEKGDKCPFQHRKNVIWSVVPVRAKIFSDQFQNSMHSSLSVFPVAHKQNFLETIHSAASEN